jgi:hypothetical protein
VKAARLWKLRQRFGIAAPKVAVSTHVPWYLRWLGIALLVSLSAAVAAWMYDAGRRFAGFDRSEVEQELAAVRHDLQGALTEHERLRAFANAADAKLSIERTAQQNLAQQIRSLEADNARLREELAIFEAMLSSDGRGPAPLSIQRFKVETELLPGEYRYRLLLLASPPKRTEFQGRYELLVSLTESGRSAMITVPDAAQAGAAGFRLSIKHIQRVEGTFRVNPKARVESVQVRVYEAGSAEPRATHSTKPG